MPRRDMQAELVAACENTGGDTLPFRFILLLEDPC
jgi:hypothetical protein